MLELGCSVGLGFRIPWDLEFPRDLGPGCEPKIFDTQEHEDFGNPSHKTVVFLYLSIDDNRVLIVGFQLPKSFSSFYLIGKPKPKTLYTPR